MQGYCQFSGGEARLAAFCALLDYGEVDTGLRRLGEGWEVTDVTFSFNSMMFSMPSDAEVDARRRFGGDVNDSAVGCRGRVSDVKEVRQL